MSVIGLIRNRQVRDVKYKLVYVVSFAFKINFGNIDNKKLEQKFKSFLTPRLLFLGNIIDRKHQLCQGWVAAGYLTHDICWWNIFCRHIILGYSINDLYLISYQLKVDGDEVNDAYFNYSLHWWQLEQGHPLSLVDISFPINLRCSLFSKVQSCRLFEGYSIRDNLEIQLYQQEGGTTIVVMGYE